MSFSQCLRISSGWEYIISHFLANVYFLVLGRDHINKLIAGLFMGFWVFPRKRGKVSVFSMFVGQSAVIAVKRCSFCSELDMTHVVGSATHTPPSRRSVDKILTNEDLVSIQFPNDNCLDIDIGKHHA